MIVSQLFDRLERLVSSYLNQALNDAAGENSTYDFADPDMAEAWDELNDFLETGRSSAAGTDRGTHPDSVPATLLPDYKLLGVQPGAELYHIKKAYIKLVKQHHPDRFANNPEKLKKATVHLQKINTAYTRIKKHFSKTA